MTHKLFAGLAAIAILMTFANTPADAGQLKRYKGVQSSHAGGFKTTNPTRRARPRHRSPRRLTNGRRQQQFNPHGASIYALSVLVRACLDNITPNCPRPK